MSDKHKLTLDTQVQQSRKVKALTANVARLTAENARMRSALEKALPYVQPIDHEGRSEDEMRESYPEYVAKVDADRAEIRRALADADTGEGRGEGWIACSERMPERLTPVLVAEAMNDGAGPIVRAAFWNGDAWRDQSATAITASDMDPTDVYAWRPLPAPPRTDDEKEEGR